MWLGAEYQWRGVFQVLCPNLNDAPHALPSPPLKEVKGGGGVGDRPQKMDIDPFPENICQRGWDHYLSRSQRCQVMQGANMFETSDSESLNLKPPKPLNPLGVLGLGLGGC